MGGGRRQKSRGEVERGGGRGVCVGGLGGGGYHIIAPTPLIICGPHLFQSLNHTSPEDSERGDLGGPQLPRRASESYTDRCQPACARVCACMRACWGLRRGNEEISKERKRSHDKITVKFAQ